MRGQGLLLVSKPAKKANGQSNERVASKAKKRREAVIEFIRSAKHSLLLSVFRCDDLSVLHELGEAVARGVRVEALMTGRAKGWGKRLGPLAGCLSRMGVVIHQLPSAAPKYHAKYMVADESKALVATLNLTRKCFRRTRDFVFTSDDSDIVTGLVELFQCDAGRLSNPEPKSDRLIIGPGSSRARIEALLRGATRSIRIMDHKLSDPAVLAIIRDRQRNGVSVEIQRGLPGDPLLPHGRLIVIDHATAVFGSFSLSARSLDGRRELAVVIQAPALVAKLNRQFDRISAPVEARKEKEQAA
ncbi:MAG: phospholipase D-like domain-containing protein [Bryobacteraceae bacterium]